MLPRAPTAGAVARCPTVCYIAVLPSHIRHNRRFPVATIPTSYCVSMKRIQPREKKEKMKSLIPQYPRSTSRVAQNGL